jgi:hypothetical protein
MSLRTSLAIAFALGTYWICASGRVIADVEAGDAYARGSNGKWTIGTSAVQMTFEVRGGKLLLSNFTNKLTKPAREYISEKDALNPLGVGVSQLNERFVVETVWEKFFPAGATVDLGADKLQLKVKKGEMIGFAVGPHGDYAGDQIDWASKIDYGDGRSYISAQDPDVSQGPIWYYYINAPGSGSLELIDSVENADDVKQKVRIPSDKSGFRAPGKTPHVGSTVLHPSPSHDAVRVWKAPKDGTVALSGIAKHIGYGDTDIKVLRIHEKGTGYQPAPKAESPWTLLQGKARAISAGGRPAVQLDLTMMHESLRVGFHVLAYPGAPVLRQWAEIENPGKTPYRGTSRDLYTIAFRPDGDTFTNYWMIGGNSQPNQGQMHAGQIGQSYRQEIAANATNQFVPWMGFRRDSGQGDGCFVALDFIGNWRLVAAREAPGAVRVSASSPELTTPPIAPGKKLELPVIFYGVFDRDLDDMSERLYNWQYEYMWDYTHDDWYAKMPFTVAWYGDSDNLQQQWAGHLGDLDMNWTDYLRTTGMELLWEDAGWSATRSWPDANMEGPDFAETRRFLTKNDMKLIVWIPGHQTTGLLDTKVGSWGNFQRRTDGMGFDANLDRVLRTTADDFLKRHPRCSYHTCSGGSTYAHTFDVQRLMDVNYDSDGPGSDYTNANWSYLETPDKWFDNLNCWAGGKGVIWNPDVGYRYITQVPKWGLYIAKDDLEPLRQMCDLYHYLLQQGVAGRWSHITHPVVNGDDQRHYCHRVSYDRKKSLIIFKHRSSGTVTICPRGLLPEKSYLVEFAAARTSATRTGADLMANGLVITDQKPGELVYLNLPHRPRSGRDKTPPKAPTRVMARRETNIGYTGVGIYGSPGSDDNWVSYYEVRRGEEIIGKASTGTYYFDRSKGWTPSATYSVRTVDGDGNASDWAAANALAHGPLVASVMGGLFSEQGRENWCYETTSDGKTFQPMTWVPAAKRPSADLGGTTIQPGGAEGYWEGGGARIGRGWQQASKNVMCIRTWTAPQPGTVQVVGRVMKEYYHRNQGEALRAKIAHNGRQVWPQSDWGVATVGDLLGLSHNVILQVAAGDAIRFVLDKGKTPAHDTLAWMPRITYTGGETPIESHEPIRILCGCNAAYTDKTGNAWSADRFFMGGEAMATDAKIDDALPTLDDQALYQHGRQGKDFSYVIPVPPGLYTVRLKFAEPKYEWFFSRPFNLSINGREVLRNADICQSARSWRKAHERVFNYVVPDAAGTIKLRFSSGWEPTQQTDMAMVQAIEVLPDSRPTMRVDCGSDGEFVDWDGFLWSADSHFQGGRTIKSRTAVAHASPTLHDQSLYQTARAGKRLSYTFAVPAGLYSVHLKFAELWLKEIGMRPMNIDINGRRFWENWDPAAQAGKTGMSADLRAEDIVPDKDGKITINVSAAGVHDAILQAIEIE